MQLTFYLINESPITPFNFARKTMCETVAGGVSHHHVEPPVITENTVQPPVLPSPAASHAHSAEADTTPKNSVTSSAPAGNNWLEEAEKIQAPAHSEVPRGLWIDYAEKVAKVAGLPEGMVTEMMSIKNARSPIDAYAAGDGTGEQVYGLLSVHGGLLEGGTYGETSHALKDAAGNALTPADMKDPAKSTLAGIQHIKQLVDEYDGDITQALNHYETGEATNNDHSMKDWCDGYSCTTETGSHGAKDHHGSASEDTGVQFKSAGVVEQLMSPENKASLESVGAKHTEQHHDYGSDTHHAEATSHSDGGKKGAEHQASSSAGTQAAHDANSRSGHGEGHGHHGAASTSGTKPADASSQSSHNEGGGHHGGKHGESSATHTAHQPTSKAQEVTDNEAHGAHGAHGEFKPSGTSSHTGVTGITGLGTDKSLQEYITPDSHSPSQHIGESHGLGFLMHRPTHDAAMETVFGKPASEVISSIQSTLEQTGTYLGNKPDTEKIKGAYLTGNMLMKQAMLPASLFGSEQNAGRAYAEAKLTAIDGDVAGLRNLIEQNGGDTLGLSDEQLRNVWATNEHNNLHGILDAGSPIGQSIHMTSLNDNAGDGTPKGTMGGYNDKGEYPQWGWFEDIQDIGSRFSGLDMNHQLDHNYK